MDDHPKILVIRFSSIGDIVLTTPVVRNLKKKYPKSSIHFLTKQQNLLLLQNSPYIDRVHLFSPSQSMFMLIRELKEENFDIIIDLQKNLRSQRIRFALRKEYHTFNKLNFRKWLLVRFKKNLMPDVHIVDRYMKAVEKLGVKNDGKGLDYFLTEEDCVPADALPMSFSDGYIVIAVGAKHKTKQMPEDLLVNLCRKIEGEILLVGDLGDKDKANRIENAVGPRVFNGCGNYSISQTASLIEGSIGVITADTGVMHIASALKKNIISVWGNTVPEFGMYPYLPEAVKDRAHIFEVKNLPCRPCSKLGHRSCPRRHFNCMKMQNVDAMVKIVAQWYRDDG